MTRVLNAWLLVSLFIAAPAVAADLPMKASPATPAPEWNWAGYYIGLVGGGGGASRSTTYTANDPAIAPYLTGTTGFVGAQPVSPNSFNVTGAVGGFEAGYNWRPDRAWLLGVEADFSGSSIKGIGSSAFGQSTGFLQTITETQKLDWYGTVRGRFGWLPTGNVLIFATGGFAYGQVSNSGTFVISRTDGGFPGISINGGGGGFSFSCLSNGSNCFAGSSSSIKTGWSVGGGVEALIFRGWSVKMEYQYINLGRDTFPLTATKTFAPGDIPSSFNVNFARDDFHVLRAGLNYHF